MIMFLFSVFSILMLTRLLFALKKNIASIFRIFKRSNCITSLRLANILSSRLENIRNEGMISLLFVGSHPKLSRQYLVNKYKSVFVRA